jgi:AAA family ATP:ADP antiporter
MINIDEAGPALSRYRSIFWPIKKGELRIFAPLLIIFFLICFNYSVLKVLKDALVVTASGSGAEVIPFIKMWGVLLLH